MSKRKGQNVAEYVILVALIIAAATAMQVYLRRGVQGRYADAVDYAPNIPLTDDTWSFNTRQYEPYYSNQRSQVTSTVGYHDITNTFGAFNRTDMSQKTIRAVNSYEASEWSNFNAR